MSDEQLTLIAQDVDQHILQSYLHLADSIAHLLGECCEVVVHQLGELSSSVIKIVNGFHTGRSVGAPITDKALKILKDYQKAPKQLKQSYFSTTNYGHLVKSTTHIILGGNGKPIGLFCINLNLSYPLDKIMANLMPQQNLAIPPKDETFVSNHQDMMKYSLSKAISTVEQHITPHQKNYKKAIITDLYDNGFFELKDAVMFVAENLRLTKYAIYKHLRELKGE
ncbi:helix-turn-helix transcriptional regulator [Rodentibacter caecimuris]|uniref:helix-turn-helix transcriptional regulator n=1 Tax=Rodentibacter caecimuris TaxID=1796644 RepID=UPI001094361F|nr:MULTISPECIES: PAS domain-containing protein [Pasteurellaceae]MCQ9123474.1 PAS domain-containing protein [Rodentibacter heylii]MCR1837215.1 PAS domain-containing protein [Pasteurella caecimuris]MCU0106282.1 PAS domain-containing protein [Pasteurella caecimuris]MCX2960876.1 PAS domain-containing protein [Rodentibacter heylii]QIA76965.1 hypothetical protein FEE42_06170 [Rodentibacter heylii]